MKISAAASYEAIRNDVRSLREDAALSRVSEWELQARLYGGEFGFHWKGEDGEEIEVKHFGSWNREPGPDFINVRAVVNGKEMTGDLELDASVADWERHGHLANPNFNRVILHVFVKRGRKRFFTRTADHRAVPQVCISLPARLISTGKTSSCLEERLSPEVVKALAMAAAQFRLRRKRLALAASRKLHGLQEALFQGLAGGLGYKNNKIAFSLVAQRAGLKRARQEDGEALLFGLAGFLNAEDFDGGDAAAKGYLRTLWERWWAMRDAERRLVLPETAWNFSALRPANHPHRRMAALAMIARKIECIEQFVERAEMRSFIELMESVEHPFWRRYSNLTCHPLPRNTAIVGKDRARDLAMNVFIPALGESSAWEKMLSMEGPDPNRKVLTAAEWLCERGTVVPMESAWFQQGLIQLYDDFFPALPKHLLGTVEKSS